MKELCDSKQSLLLEMHYEIIILKVAFVKASNLSAHNSSSMIPFAKQGGWSSSISFQIE